MVGRLQVFSGGRVWSPASQDCRLRPGREMHLGHAGSKKKFRIYSDFIRQYRVNPYHGDIPPNLIHVLLRDLPRHLAREELEHRTAQAPLDGNRLYDLIMASTEDHKLAERVSAEFELERLKHDSHSE